MAKKHGGGKINEMESGLLHCADSLSGGERGTFVDYFGAPGSPDEKNPTDRMSGPGSQPRILPEVSSGSSLGKKK